MGGIRALALLLAAAVAGWCLSAGAETVLALGYVLGPTSHYGVAAQVMADEVATRSNGRYRVQLFPDGQLGGEREMAVGAQIGTVDLVLISTGPVGSFVPATLITDIPFLFRDTAHARMVLDGPIGQEILADFPAHGLIGLAWGENGFRHLTTSGRPVSHPADLAGLKLRVMQNAVHLRAFAVLGALPVPLPFPKLYGALKSGAVDGEENPIPVILDGRFAEVQKYLSLTAHVYSPAAIVMAPRLWQSLSEADRTAFREAARLAAAAQRAEVDRADREGLATLRAAGMTVIEDVDRPAFQAALAPAYAEYTTFFGKDRIDRIRDARP